MGQIRNLKYKVNEKTGCFEVTSQKPNRDGYIRIRLTDRITGKRKGIYAHRYSFMIHKGEIPSGHVIRHTCDNPVCINPEHLISGTHADNVRDKIDRGRLRTVGENNPRAKLTYEIVSQIRSSMESGANLARRYGVSETTISKIRKKDRWVELC